MKPMMKWPHASSNQYIYCFSFWLQKYLMLARRDKTVWQGTTFLQLCGDGWRQFLSGFLSFPPGSEPTVLADTSIPARCLYARGKNSPQPQSWAKYT